MAAWQNSGVQFGPDASLEELLAGQEIAVARYDETDQIWEQVANLTQNNYLDRSPQLAASSNKVVAVWVTNEQGDMLGKPDKPNKLKSAFFNGTLWSVPSEIATYAGAIVKSALAYDDQSAVYVFAGDADGDLSTVEDQDLYKVVYDGTTWSTLSRLTNDSLQDANPQLAYDSTGALLLLWYRDGDFVMASNLDMANSKTVLDREPSSGAADFRLATGNNGQVFLVWPDSSPAGQDLYFAMYDPNMDVWGKGSRITDSDSVERSVTVTQMSSGAMAAVFNKVTTQTETRQVTVGGEILNVQVPVPGPTDLCMAIVDIEGDLKVAENSLQVSSAGSRSVNLAATVENIGLNPRQNIAVNFYYGDPSSNGTLIGSGSIASPLPAGESAPVSVTGWAIPDNPDSSKAIFVVVDPSLALQDRDRANNTVSLSLFKPELSIAQMFCQALGPVKRGITVTVENSGAVPATDIPVVIGKYGSDGPIFYEGTLAYLASGQSADVACDWDTASESPEGGSLTAWAGVNMTKIIPEQNYLNNSRTIKVLGLLPEPIASTNVEDGATNVPVKAVLNWSDSVHATEYDIYLWKSAEPKPSVPRAGAVLQSQYTPSGLKPLTQYSWQIVARNASGESTSPEWSFTTKGLDRGDINGDGVIDLADAVLALQVISNQSAPQQAYVEASIGGEGKIGLQDVSYILQRAAAVR
jgi:hypothetical protein